VEVSDLRPLVPRAAGSWARDRCLACFTTAHVPRLISAPIGTNCARAHRDSGFLGALWSTDHRMVGLTPIGVEVNGVNLHSAPGHDLGQRAFQLACSS